MSHCPIWNVTRTNFCKLGSSNWSTPSFYSHYHPLVKIAAVLRPTRRCHTRSTYYFIPCQPLIYFCVFEFSSIPSRMYSILTALSRTFFQASHFNPYFVFHTPSAVLFVFKKFIPKFQASHHHLSAYRCMDTNIAFPSPSYSVESNLIHVIIRRKRAPIL